MPPKAKFERKDIVDAAIEILESDGVEALTARTIGEKLNSSARPIFTVFKNMSEVISETEAAAKKIYDSYVADGLAEPLAFKGVGKAYIKFATEHPKLFQLLFMREQKKIPKIENALELIDGNSQLIIQSIQSKYSLDVELSNKLYAHMWIYSHGIAVLIATRMCEFSQEQISDMLTEVCVSMIKKIKTEGKL